MTKWKNISIDSAGFHNMRLVGLWFKISKITVDGPDGGGHYKRKI